MESSHLDEQCKKRKRKKSTLWLNKPKKRKVNVEQTSTCIKTPQNQGQTYEDIYNAPKKNKRKIRKGKKCLFNASECNDKVINDIQELIPGVVLRLQKEGLLADFVNMLSLIKENRFPLNNISFRLMLEVARWYKLDSSDQMFYSEETKLFWKVVYRLFHGKAIRFLSGKSHDSDVQEDPKETIINFAVPNMQTICNFQPVGVQLPKEILPGVISFSLELKLKSKSYILSVDGKKLAPGLSSSYGDQDLFGHENGESLESLKSRIADEIELVEDTQKNWGIMTTEQRIDKLYKIVNIVSLRIKDLRHLFKNQEAALKKFEKEAGDDWRTFKYVYAISSIQAMVYQIRVLIKRLLSTNNSIMMLGSTLQLSYHNFCEEEALDAFTQGNWISLKYPEELPKSFFTDIRFIKQRTSQWFEKRGHFKITGSKLYDGIGLDTLKTLQKIMEGKNINDELSDEVRKRMEHGTKSEIHATATLVGKVLPFYYPNLKFVEEGAHVLWHNNKELSLISPDGSLRNLEITPSSCIRSPVLGCEFKCPTPNAFKTPVHYDIPKRYIPQILGEMAALNTSQLLYVCWTEESSTVIKASFDTILWNSMHNEVVSLYGGPVSKKPTRTSDNLKFIKSRLAEYNDRFTEFLCEVPSIKGLSNQMSQNIEEWPYLSPISSVRESSVPIQHDLLFAEIVIRLKEAYQLCRKKASEVLVWLFSDTDRSWNPEVPHSLPVAYAMKGYSLPVSPMRSMHEDILQSCHQRQLNVVCSCFDGQWIKLATRDVSGLPLTQLQLQKNVWELTKKLSRDCIIKAIGEIKLWENIVKEIKGNGSISISCGLYAKLQRCITEFKKNSKKMKCYESERNTIPEAQLPEEALEVLITNDQAKILEEVHSDILTKPHNTEGELDNREVDDSENITQDTNQSGERELNRNQTIVLNDTEYQSILVALQSHKKSSIKEKWKNKSPQDVRAVIKKAHSLLDLKHDELNIIIDCTTQHQTTANHMIRKSWRLVEKANAISVLFGDGNAILVEKTVPNMLTLKEIALKAIKRQNSINAKAMPKDLLNCVHATISFPALYQEWYTKCPLKTDIDGIGSVEWFSYPEFSVKRQKLEPKCVDAHHLLVNLRSKVCKDGLENINKHAWVAVAEYDRDVISKSLVVDLIDKQNNAFAKRTFSVEVETVMRNLQYSNEANFCRLVRDWYEAEDAPGIPAKVRVERKLRLRDYLLGGVDFGNFPVYGMYIKGFPKGMFESFLQRIDTTIQLYDMIPTGTYNQRAVSSLVNETFFGELAEMEPTHLGCPKAVQIPRLMSTVAELLHYRCNPDERCFRMSTTRKSVYPVVKLKNTSSNSNQDKDYSSNEANGIVLRDHEFDLPSRSRRKQRISKRSDVSKPGQVTRGCLPVRQHHKSDESKILATRRLGIEDFTFSERT